MPVGEICNRDVVITPEATTALEAAQLMLNHHVGSIVVVDNAQPPHPVGIVTDRDLVLKVMAAGRDPASIKVTELMHPNLITIDESDHNWAALERMRTGGIRRLVVVNQSRHLQGILTMDDMLDYLADELSELVKAVKREQLVEAAGH